MAKDKKTKAESKRNLVRQEITLEDGTKKVIWHQKKFSSSQYADRKFYWDLQNKSPKPNSKRQKQLKEQKVSILEDAA